MTAEATDRAPAGEAGFDPGHVQALADIDLIAMRERVEAWLPLTDRTEGLGL